MQAKGHGATLLQPEDLPGDFIINRALLAFNNTSGCVDLITKQHLTEGHSSARTSARPQVLHVVV